MISAVELKKKIDKVEAAILEFANNEQKITQEAILVSAIIGDQYMESIIEEIGEGYMNALFAISECVKSWCKEFNAEIIDEKTDWEEVSKKHAASDWEEMVVNYAGRWFLEYKKVRIKYKA